MLSSMENFSHEKTVSYLNSLLEKPLDAETSDFINEAITSLLQGSHDTDTYLDFSLIMGSLMIGDVVFNMELALHYCQKALSLLSQDDSPEQWAGAKYTMGNLYVRRVKGDTAENRELAIKHLQEVIAFIEEEDSDFDIAADVYAELGNAYFQRIKGDTADNKEQAIHYLQKALELITTEDEDKVPIMGYLGLTYLERIMGEPSENRELAIKYFQQALSLAEQDNDLSALALSNAYLGHAYMHRILGDNRTNKELSIHHFQQALSVFTQDTYPFFWAIIMYNLSYIYREQGTDYEKAIDYLEHVLSVWTKEDFPSYWADAMYSLGLVYSERSDGDNDKNKRQSVDCLQSALSVLNQDSQPSLYCSIQFALGRVFKDLKVLEKAFSSMNDALRALFHTHREIAHPEARNIYLKNNISDCHCVIHTLLQQKRYSDSLYWLERLRSVNLLEDINLEILKPAKREANELVRQYWHLCHRVRKLRAILYGDEEGQQSKKISVLNREDQANNQDKRIEEDLRESIKRKNDLFIKIREIDSGYATAIQYESLSEAELFHLLSATESAAVTCFVDRDNSAIHFLIIYTHDSELLYKHIVVEDSLESLTEALHNFHTNQSRDLRPLEVLLKTVGTVAQPIADFLKELKITRIYFSPHDLIQAIPFHAALLPQSQRYFIEDFHVCYTPSLTVSYRLFNSNSNSGNKVVGLFHAPEQEYLQYGQKEFERLKDIYGSRLISLKDNDATLEKLSRVLNDKKEDIFLMNLISHGKTTSLHLSNGYVSASELVNQLDLSGLPLVILGACETGKSDDWLKGYEEYRALDSAFLQMGSKSVISSFYSIDDKWTSEVMKEFHLNINKKQSPVDALCSAQKKIIHKRDLKDTTSVTRGRNKKSDLMITIHPYYWAFLKCSGTF